MSQEKTIETLLEGTQLQPIYDLLETNPQQSKKICEEKTLRLLFEKFDPTSIIKLIDHCVARELISLNDVTILLLLTTAKLKDCEDLAVEVKKKISESWWSKFNNKSFNSFVEKLIDHFFIKLDGQMPHSRINFLKHIISFLDENYIFEKGALLKNLITEFSNDALLFFKTLENLLTSALIRFIQDNSLQVHVKSKTRKNRDQLLNTLFFGLIDSLDYQDNSNTFRNIYEFEDRFLILIVEALESVQPPNEYEKTTLHELCQKSCSLKLLTAIFQRLNTPNIDECTTTKKSKISFGFPLHYAALYSTFEVFEFIATRTSALNINVNNDGTALMMAINGGVDAAQKVQYLLSSGKDIGLHDQTFYEQKNCLHLAVLKGQLAVVQLLMATENAREKLNTQDCIYKKYDRANRIHIRTPNKHPLDYALELLYQHEAQKTDFRGIILSLISDNPDNSFLMQLYTAGITVFQQRFNSESKQAIEDEILFFAEKYPALVVREPALKLGSVKLLRKMPTPFPNDILIELLNTNLNQPERRTAKDVTSCFIYLANTQPELIHSSENEMTLLTLSCIYHYYDIAAFLFHHPQYTLKISDCDLISDFDIERGSLQLLTAIINRLSRQFSSLRTTSKKLPTKSLTVHYDANNPNQKRHLIANDSIHDEMQEYISSFAKQFKFERAERNLAVICLTFFGRTDQMEEDEGEEKKKYTRAVFHVRLNIESENHINSQGEERSRFRHMIIAGYPVNEILETKRHKDQCSKDENGKFFLEHWHSERSLLSKLTTPNQIQLIVQSLIEQKCRKIYAILVNIYTVNYPCEACVEAANITQSSTDKGITFVDILNEQIEVHNQTAEPELTLKFKDKARSYVLTLFTASTPWPKGTKRLERDDHRDNEVIDLKSPPSERVLFRDSVSMPPTKSGSSSQAKYTVASSGCDKILERTHKRAKTDADDSNSAPSNK